VSVAHVVERSGVSRRTFYEHFADREDCFLAAFDRAVGSARGLVRAAYEQENGWREGMRSGLGRLLLIVDEEPSLARVCVVEALGAGPRLLERRAEVMKELADVIDRGRSLASGAYDPPDLTSEAIAGAVFAILHTRLLEGSQAPFTKLLGPLMSIIVLPYLGARVAGSELSGPAVKSRKDGSARALSRTKDPLGGLKMRLTHRTVRVLTAVARQPGASNREIAEGSGIADQGQISKLLTRLARLELVVNTGEGPERGASNAWHLTARGEQVERATRGH
jgi:AcrR family transcriptional regulator